MTEPDPFIDCANWLRKRIAAEDKAHFDRTAEMRSHLRRIEAAITRHALRDLPDGITADALATIAEQTCIRRATR